VTHGVIYEPDHQCREILEAALASLYWSVVAADSLSEAARHLPGPWAMILAVESGDIGAVDTIRDLRKLAPSTAICVLVDEASPEFDRQLHIAGVDQVFAKPVQETEIVEALVAGFMARRG
jgi:DNA-binding response OmpR family regulator